MSLLTVLQAPTGGASPIAASGESRLRLTAHSLSAVALAVLVTAAPLQLGATSSASASLQASAESRHLVAAQGASSLTIGANAEARVVIAPAFIAGEATPIAAAEGRLNLNALGAAGLTVGAVLDSQVQPKAQGAATLPLGASADGRLKLGVLGTGGAGSVEIVANALASLRLWGQSHVASVSALLGEFLATFYTTPVLDANLALAEVLEADPYVSPVLTAKDGSPAVVAMLEGDVSSYPVLTVGITSPIPPLPLLLGDFSDDFADDFFT